MQYQLCIYLALSAVVTFAVKQLAQPLTYLKPKIFVLGLSKTGTTSVGDALALLGYKRLGWEDIKSRHLVQVFLHGELDALIDQSRYFDAFEDLPWPHIYREMAEMYPDAKFILSLRKDEKTWLESLRRHMKRRPWPPATYFYGADDVDGNEETVLSYYRNHTTNVRKYFQDKPNRYAELVIDDGDANWEALCSLAQCPKGGIPTVGFPKSNIAAHWGDVDYIVYLRELWDWTLTRIEEKTAYFYYQRKWRIVNWMLEQAWHLVSIVEFARCNLYFRFVVENQAPLPVA